MSNERRQIDPNAWIDYAKNLLSKRKKTIDSLKGKRIRVVRAIIFEGPAEAVLKQLARSLPEGDHYMPVAGEHLQGRQLHVKVVQDELKIVDE